MNITIFPTGTGDAKSAVRYLLSDIDHNKKKRIISPEIIFGDPESFIAISNSTARKHKYTSGVIALRDTEALSDRQIDEVIKSFRATFLPGLEADKNYADFWVAHREKGNLELHFLYANTELTSGSQLNIHPPGEKNIQFFNTYVSVLNDTLGFAQVVPDPLKIALKPFEAKSHNGGDIKNAKNELSTKLHTNILNGKIKNRNQLIGFLTKIGVPVTAVSPKYITVTIPGTEKSRRLKGPLFDAKSDYETLITEHYASKIPKFLSPTESEQQKNRLAHFVKERFDFNQTRYFKKKPGSMRSRHPSNRVSEETESNILVGNTKTITHAQNKMLSRVKATTDDRENSISILASQVISKAINEHKEVIQKSDSSSELDFSNGGSSLEAQIGSLSLQYHTLLVQLAGAKGNRAQVIRSKIVAIQQRLEALSMQVEKMKVTAKDKNSIL